AVFLRKYWNISSKFYAFAHTNLGYSRDKSTVDYKNGSGFQRFSTTKGWSVSASVTPGIAYSVSKKVQLESTFIPVIRANYSKFKVDYNNYSPKQTDGSDFSIEGGLQTGQYFSLGIRFLLGK
ncbi:MAG: hypothetical protein J7527_19520, partial [Chitinophagaceae bacterium]|nr:hypothetical protein [Chitinophagaceae bacterium]